MGPITFVEEMGPLALPPPPPPPKKKKKKNTCVSYPPTDPIFLTLNPNLFFVDNLILSGMILLCIGAPILVYRSKLKLFKE